MFNRLHIQEFYVPTIHITRSTETCTLEDDNDMMYILIQLSYKKTIKQSSKYNTFNHIDEAKSPLQLPL